MTDESTATHRGAAQPTPTDPTTTSADDARVRPTLPEARDRLRAIALAPDGPDEMGRELAEGPAAVVGTLEAVESAREAWEGLSARTSRTMLVGTGASLAMARAAAPDWRRGPNGRGAGRAVVVRESTAAVLDGADGEAFEPTDLVVAISQSGDSPETVGAASLAGRAGSAVVAVTANASSRLAGLAALTIVTPSGTEGGAATKSELSALAALFALSGGLRVDAATRDALGRSLERVVGDWQPASAVAPALAATDRIWFVGSGVGAAIAGAAGLLWHEKVHRSAVATSVSEFRHGPVEAASAADTVVVVDVDPPVAAREAYLALLRSELARIGTVVLEIAPTPGESAQAIPLRSRSGPEAALEALLRVQQVARATAHAAGTYRDGFRILREIVRAAPALD